MPISQVLLSDTFGQFRNAFNETANAVNSVVSTTGNIVTGNIVGSTLTANNLTSGRVGLHGAGGQLTDDSALTYNTSTDVLTLGGTTDATAANNGTLVVSGGVGIAKKLYVGTDLAVTGNTTLSTNLTVTGNATVTGNLTINGTTTTVNSTTLTVDDKNIELGSVATPTDVTADGGGITLKGATDKTISWSSLGWTSSEDFNLVTGKVFEINGTSVLSSTTLGSGVTGSSLTSVGTLTSLTVSGNTALGDSASADVHTINGATTLSVNSANAALRINQIGAGNALLVEDSANPDATPVVIDSVGTVVAGHTSSLNGYAGVTTRQVSSYEAIGENNAGTGLAIFAFSTATNAPRATVNFNKSNNANVAVHGIVTNGEVLGALNFSGSDGTEYMPAAQIHVAVDGTPGANDMPGSLVFSTTADGSNTPVERVRIDSAGRLRQFGDTILSNVNVIGASYDNVSFSVTSQETQPTALFFSPDGLKMYVAGSSGDDVNEYNLSTAWVVSSAVYSTVFSVAGQDTSPQGLFFRADGRKMYMLGQTNDAVFQYTLSTPWSVATASYDSISFSVATQDLTSVGLWFKPNGLSMYVVGSTGDAVYQYTLSTAWNVSTATFLQSFSISGQDSVSAGINFTGDGSRMFVLGTTGDDVNVYNLTTPWDISTSAFVNVFSVAGQDAAPNDIYIKPDGTKMYMVGSTNDGVFQYTVPSIDIQLTGQTSVAALDVQQDLNVYGILSTAALTASGNVSFTSTGALKIPSGTTAQNAGYATVGMIRYDTTLGRLEVYKSTGWAAVGGGVSAAKAYFFGNF